MWSLTIRVSRVSVAVLCPSKIQVSFETSSQNVSCVGRVTLRYSELTLAFVQVLVVSPGFSPSESPWSIAQVTVQIANASANAAPQNLPSTMCWVVLSDRGRSQASQRWQGPRVRTEPPANGKLIVHLNHTYFTICWRSAVKLRGGHEASHAPLRRA